MGNKEAVEGGGGVGEVEQAFGIAFEAARVVAVNAVAEYRVRCADVVAVGASARAVAGTCRVITPAGV